MRISEYNLRTNNYFNKGIFGHSAQERKQLEIMREQIVTYASSKYPGMMVTKALKQLKKYNKKGVPYPDMPTEIDEIVKLIENKTKCKSCGCDTTGKSFPQYCEDCHLKLGGQW